MDAAVVAELTRALTSCCAAYAEVHIIPVTTDVRQRVEQLEDHVKQLARRLDPLEPADDTETAELFDDLHQLRVENKMAEMERDVWKELDKTRTRLQHVDAQIAALEKLLGESRVHADQTIAALEKRLLREGLDMSEELAKQFNGLSARAEARFEGYRGSIDGCTERMNTLTGRDGQVQELLERQGNRLNEIITRYNELISPQRAEAERALEAQVERQADRLNMIVVNFTDLSERAARSTAQMKRLRWRVLHFHRTAELNWNRAWLPELPP